MSKIIAIMPCRNEDWILGLSARAALMWADELVILDHASTDKSPDIYWDVRSEHHARVTVLVDNEPEWQEMRHRQMLLDTARQMGATHVVICDADEVLSGNLLPTIRGDIDFCNPRCILQLPWIQLRGGVTEYHSAGVWAEQWVSFAFHDSPELHWAQRDGYDFHHRHPMGRQLLPFRPVPRKRGGLMHLQMASERRLRAKQALYKMTEVLRWPGRSTPEELNRQYNVAVYGEATMRRDPHVMAKCPREWWEPYHELMDKYLRVDAEPWQEAEAVRLMKEHGPDKFSGLDLFGVCG